jgi:hypothetical protein
MPGGMMKTTPHSTVGYIKEREKFEFGETIKEVVVRVILDVQRNLEKITVNLDKNLPSIKAGKMPEYANAIDAIKKYYSAIQNKISSLNAPAGRVSGNESVGRYGMINHDIQHLPLKEIPWDMGDDE